MPRDCPCHSGRRYADCCKPLHDGQQAETPEALMRSRFAAYALGLGEYLVDTLSADHADREVPRPQLVREFAQLKDQRKFMGLRIVHAEGDEVLFDARIFQKGKNISFAELSTFVREHGAWKYASGRLVPRPFLPDGFTREQFLEAADRCGA